jgi:plastocyanin
MSMRNLAVLTLAAPFILVACGGGGQSNDTASTTATTMAAGGAAGSGTTGGGAAAGGGSGSISGKVTFTGTAPAPEKIKTSADPKCAEMHKDGLVRESVEVHDGGLANTLVYVKNPPAGAGGNAHMEEVVLDQQGCMYHPSMLAVRVGEPVKIRNSDDTLHNIHPRPTINAEFNVGQPRKGMESTKTFDKEEILIPVGCDVHPWMRSYIAVLSHPFFAVTKEDGSYEIKGLPAGDYEVEANHPKLKTSVAKVTVKNGDTAKLDLPFKG